jgi:hypothetical protein
MQVCVGRAAAAYPAGVTPGQWPQQSLTQTRSQSGHLGTVAAAAALIGQ